MTKQYHGKNDGRAGPETPVAWTDAHEITRDTFHQLKPIKQILTAHGMGPNWPDEAWPFITTHDELCQIALRITCELQSIKALLIDAGLADEREFIPLKPRWRVDDQKHHARNAAYFVFSVLSIIYAPLNDQPSVAEINKCIKKLGFNRPPKEMIEYWLDHCSSR